jgi:starch phosphorylase
MNREPNVVYLSMEIALEAELPTYSGGLGVLAGDTLRSAADLGLSLAAVSLVYRNGYFRQEIGSDGVQRALPAAWRPESHLELMEPRVKVNVADTPVTVRAWRYRIRGEGGHEVPVYLLDTDLPENAPDARRFTDNLYGGDDRYRLCQEIVLGIGGVRMLRALGYDRIDRCHLNEGHAALAVLALVEEEMGRGDESGLESAIERARSRCVFTTHTPVPAGHDRFPRELAMELVGSEAFARLEAIGMGDELNMTALALDSSHFINGVAMRHGEVSRGMFPGYPISAITNGVHAGTWAAPPFQALFDRHVPDWRRDTNCLRGLIALDPEEFGAAHAEAKRALLDAVHNATGQRWDPNRLTLGFARRATAYKRPTLIFRDMERLRRLASRRGPIQLVFAGKAHPHDGEGHELIRSITQEAGAQEDDLEVVFLPGYDMELGRLMVAGVDVWLNTPIPLLEASGTSGMKAAMNGVPSLSVLDGWWIEGCVEGVTGWAIGEDGDGQQLTPDERDDLHADELYSPHENAVLPAFYERPQRMREIMRSAIALNGSFFNTHRMVLQYLFEAYRDPGTPPGQAEPEPGVV